MFPVIFLSILITTCISNFLWWTQCMRKSLVTTTLHWPCSISQSWTTTLNYGLHFFNTNSIQAEDAAVPHIIHTLKKCIEISLPSAPKSIKLKRFVAQSYIGLFLEENGPTWFREVMKNFAVECKRHGEYMCVYVLCDMSSIPAHTHTIYTQTHMCSPNLHIFTHTHTHTHIYWAPCVILYEPHSVNNEMYVNIV